MVFDIVIIVLILAIAFYQAIQGMFSAIIMAILSVLCAMAALNFYEPLATMLGDRLGAYAHSSALLAVFVIPLLVVRIAFDRVIRGNVVMGLWPDRIGGGVFGLVTATVLMGMLMLIVMMLPLPGSFLAYRPYNASLEVEHGMGAAKAAHFTLGMAKLFSRGSLAPLDRVEGEATFGDAHDDLYLESFCFRNRPPGARASTPANALDIKEVYRLPKPDRADERYKEYVNGLKEKGWTKEQLGQHEAQLEALHQQTPKYPLLPPNAETDVYVVRAIIDDTARNETDSWYRLPATAFQLVTNANKSYYPVGYLTFGGRWRVEAAGADPEKAEPANVLIVRKRSAQGSRELLVDWVYRIGEGETPREVIFRRVARANTRPIGVGVPEPKVDGKFVALTVKPGAREADFEKPSSRRLLYPVKMRRTQNIHRTFILRLLKGAVKPKGMYTDTVVQDRNLHRGVYQSTVNEMEKVGGMGSHAVYNLTPPADYSVVQVDCNVAQAFSDREAAGMLAALDPKLILTDGTTLSHRGAYLAYGSVENRNVLFYYEPKEADAAEHLRTKLRKALAANISTVQNDRGCGFIFLVPTDAVSAVGMSFGMAPGYEFYSVKPMASTGGRRR